MRLSGHASLSEQRVTALVGPAGSGKTELAIALALDLVSSGTRVVLADLDVVKPYFRSREARTALRHAGVSVVAPEGELATADLPIVTGDLRLALTTEDQNVVLDVGGDPVGARALGSISDAIPPGGHDLLLVLNRFRPFMDTLERVLDTTERIEQASQLKVTGVVSNGHLLDETTLDHVLSGLELARAVADRLGVPVRGVGVPEHLAESLPGGEALPPAVAVRRRMLPTFLGGTVL